MPATTAAESVASWSRNRLAPILGISFAPAPYCYLVARASFFHSPRRSAMFRAGVCVMAVVAFLWGGGLMAEDAKTKKKDPPKQMEGPIKKLDTKDPEAVYVTITVKRMQPTDKEDVLQEVDKDY